MEKNRGNCGRNLWNESKRGSREVRDFKKRKRDRRVSTRSVRTKKCKKRQKKYHIDLCGKDIYQVLSEINEQKVLQMADELNMDKTNMNTQELAEKIKKDHPEKGKELKFCTRNSHGC